MFPASGKNPSCRLDFYKLSPSSSQDKDDETKNSFGVNFDKDIRFKSLLSKLAVEIQAY